MSKTISMTGNPPDIDGSIATGVQSLEQRIHQAFRFRLGEWFLRTDKGIDYNFVFSHQINLTQVTQVLVKVVEDTGGDEILSVDNVFYQYDPSTRRYLFRCDVETIYGNLSVSENF